MRPPAPSRKWILSRAAALGLCAFTMTGSPAEAHAPIGFALAKAFGFVAGNAKLIDVQASRAYRRAARTGTCSERQAAFAAILPEAVRLSHYARDIYDHRLEPARADAPPNEARANDAPPSDAQEAREGTTALGNGWTAHFEAGGKHYAEVFDDPAARELIIVFRGTRLNVTSDLSADVLSMTGIETAYFKWASALVGRMVHAHPGRQVVVTGHSLGGGLVIHAVLHNKGVKGIAFNPSGLSWIKWLATSKAERQRASAALTIVATRNAGHIEPVTAIALARRTVLPGHIFFAEADAIRPLVLHSAATVVATLEHMQELHAEELPCEDVIGTFAR